MKKCSFAVISDIHYFSPKLTDGKRAYELRSGSDQKCLLESSGIVDAAFEKLKNDKDVDFVLIPGDLSDDGEICSHLELTEKLVELNKHKPVYVTTATHDFCCDGNAREYFGDTERPHTDTADIPFLRKNYARFGEERATEKYEIFNGLCSYTAKVSNGVTLVALNDDQSGKDTSGYDDEHFEWIISRMRQAKENGDTVIAIQHHVVVPHFTNLLTKAGICCGERQKVAEKFAESGADLLFVGHSHWQNITEYEADNGNIMTQINVGSLSGYPAPIFKVCITDEKIEMHTEYVESFEYDGKMLGTEYLKEHTLGIIKNVLMPAVKGDKAEFISRLGALGVHSEAVEKLFFLIKKLAVYIESVNVGKFAKAVNILTFGKGINKNSAEEIKETLVINIIYGIFLNLFDGGIKKYEKGSPLYNVVSDFVSIPSRAVKNIGFVPANIKNILDEIHETVCLIMDDGTDNNRKTIEL